MYEFGFMDSWCNCPTNNFLHCTVDCRYNAALKMSDEKVRFPLFMAHGLRWQRYDDECACGGGGQGGGA